MKNTLVFPWSFDPWTYWHEAVLTDYLDINPEWHIEVLVADNPWKNRIFSPNESKILIEKTIPEEIKRKIKVITHTWLIADYVYENWYSWILKWVRNPNDFQYEVELAQATQRFSRKVKTIIIPQLNPIKNWISSSVLKAISKFSWDIASLTYPLVREALRMKQSWKLILWVTWWIASWKSTLCKALLKYSEWKDTKINYINLDEVTRQIHSRDDLPIFQIIRNEIANIFWENVLNKDGTTNKQVLWEIVFLDTVKMEVLMNILIEPIIYFLRKEVEKIPENSIILVEWAIIFDRNLTYLFDENIIHIWTDKEEQIKRVSNRDWMSNEQIKNRIKNQLSREQRIEWIKKLQSFFPNQSRIFIDIDWKSYNIWELHDQLVWEYEKRKRFEY